MQTSKQIYRAMARAVVISALLVGLVPLLVQAQTRAAKAKPAAAQTESPAGGAQEGIKVHGHWTIDVRNPDGSLASHHDLENALTQNGAEVLARLLGRFSVAGEWLIDLIGDAQDDPCEITRDGAAMRAECLISERSVLGPNWFPTLVRTLGTPPTSVELSGAATASRRAVISSVHTLQRLCPDPTLSPAACSGSEALAQFGFAGRSLPNGIAVVPGQIIQVKVRISFSCGEQWCVY
jgi:hypothetical protein